MPVIEYVKQSEHQSSGRTIPKGTQHLVSRERARELQAEGLAEVVDTESTRTTQQRVRSENQAAPAAPTADNTVPEIKDWLDENEIEYKSTDRKDDLLNKVNNHK